jgi:chemotaxis protein methyltransferase CheR
MSHISTTPAKLQGVELGKRGREISRRREVKDSDCVHFLQQVLPQLRLRWSGFRRVRRQVCRRLRSRLQELNLASFSDYAAYLLAHPYEWSVVDSCCRITISRFYRDKQVFEQLSRELPKLARLAIARGDSNIRCWSAGCASGEEVYTLKLLEHFYLSRSEFSLPLQILATDVDEYLLSRAKSGCYASGTLKELPRLWIEEAFAANKQYCLKPTFREGIQWEQQDIRKEMPDGSFHLILCRNLAFTYFEPALQQEILRRIMQRLVSGGILLIGKRESLPDGWPSQLLHISEWGIYQKSLPDLYS